jgi:hypothetical protein
MLTKICGYKRENSTRGWTRLQNEELHDLYSPPQVAWVIKMTWMWLVQCTVKIRNSYTVLVGKTGGKKPLGRPRYTWVDNIKIYIKETGWEEWNLLIRLRIGTYGKLLCTW